MAGYYTSGEFAKKANVSIRTIRYYDKQGLLKPAAYSDGGYRLYTDEDFVKLQKILSLKYLGFSLDEIYSMTINDESSVESSLKMQLDLVRKRIEHFKLVENTLKDTIHILKENSSAEWENILHLIHVTNMEKSLVEQYKDAANIDIRISLHKKYSVNKKNWFEWIYDQIEEKISASGTSNVLEIGCGNGEIWKINEKRIPEETKITLSDISEGMLQDVKKRVDSEKYRFVRCDCNELPFPDQSFDIIMANHVLFYLKDLDKGLSEIKRVLKPEGKFYCSTYGNGHMKEISQLVKEFDSRIVLSDVNLYDVFGLDHGKEILEKYFNKVHKKIYEDHLEVDQVSSLIDYILSCHGNQKEYLPDRYNEFKEFLEKKMQKKGFIFITKEAGCFECSFK